MLSRQAPWWKPLAELIVLVGCAMGVLLVMANTPSLDELQKGLLAGVVSFIISQFANRSHV